MKRHGIDSHINDKKYSTLVYVPHSGKPSKTYRLTAPLAKVLSMFMIFAVVIVSLALVLSYFIMENQSLNEKNAYIISKYQEQITASNLYIDRQAAMLEDKLAELNQIEFTQNSISGGLMNLASKLENVSTQYFMDLPGTTSSTINYNKIDEFIESIKDINTVLNQFDGMAELSESQIVQFKSIRETLTGYLENVPSLWPTESTYISSDFGIRWHPIYKKLLEHTGMDIGGAYGDDIYASGSGTVIMSGYNSGYGYSIRIDHGDGITTLYAHASRLLVKTGDTVKKGQVIARVGSSGLSTGSHLHFEVRIDNVPVDPMPFINNREE